MIIDVTSISEYKVSVKVNNKKYEGALKDIGAYASTLLANKKDAVVCIVADEDVKMGYITDITESLRANKLLRVSYSSKVILKKSDSANAKQPLYVVDGVIIEDEAKIKAIEPKDIESLTVLKEASATALYGDRGSNGVVVVTLK